MDAYLTSETLSRAALFVLILLVMLGWEWRLPRRTGSEPVTPRRVSNLAIGLLNILILRIGFPLLGFALAVMSASSGWGLFNLVELPGWLTFLLSVLLLDLLIWAQHRLFHRQPLLWRLHRMHHADQVFDVTTAVRFHPLEAILSMFIKSLAIVLLGVPPLSFLVFEIILSSTSLFNHGNVILPGRVDALLRWLVVTPDMHRVHHSIDGREMNRNFGFSLPWWDRLFGTYLDQPSEGHQEMQIGLETFRSEEEQRLDRLLTQPFRSDV